jgi:hypothetical protein
MAQSQIDLLRQDLSEIRRGVEEFRRELGIGSDGNGTSSARRTGVRRSGGLLRALRSPRHTPFA